MLTTRTQASQPRRGDRTTEPSNSAVWRVSKRLIVNADDLGLSHGITDAILQCHAKGIVTSASFMVNQPATQYAADRLREYSNLDVGIHLNLCQGRPVLPPHRVPSLVDSDGSFLQPGEMGRRLIRWQVSSKEIEAEFIAQIERMMSLGLRPSHADSHHRFHIYPAAAAPFRNALKSVRIERVRSAKKSTWPNPQFGGAHAGVLFRRVAVDVYNRFLQSAVFGELKSPDAGIALHPKFRGKLSRLPEAWMFALANMPSGTYEIWCHPGFAEPGFSEHDPLREQRCVEAAMLIDPLLSRIISKAGIQLITFRSL
jgi:predicted glycoside hydrolase/deacetylase ChbG (UPF0249 family)